MKYAFTKRMLHAGELALPEPANYSVTYCYTCGYPVADTLWITSDIQNERAAAVDGLGEFGVASHPVAVAADVDDAAAVEEPVQERNGHHLVAEDPAPFLEALVRGQDRRSAALAPIDELEEEDRAALGHRQVADLVVDQQRGVGQGVEPSVEPACGLGLLQRVDQVGQGSEVDLAAALGRGDRQADSLEEAEFVCSASICSRLTVGWKPKSKLSRVWTQGRRLERMAASRRRLLRSANLGGQEPLDRLGRGRPAAIATRAPARSDVWDPPGNPGGFLEQHDVRIFTLNYLPQLALRFSHLIDVPREHLHWRSASLSEARQGYHVTA